MLEGKVAVITGAARGIGKEIALKFASEGCDIAFTDLVIDENGKKTEEEIAAFGVKCKGYASNAADFTATEEVVKQIKDDFGHIDILVNNAGLGGGGRENPFKIDREYVERIYSINVFAPWRLCQLTVPHMAESGYGSIINITSISSTNTEPNMGIYGSSKAALTHLSANLAFDFGPMDVRINCVAPGAVRTHALASVITPELEEKMLRHTPIRRLGNVSDIAGAILYFAAPASAWISGQVLVVNGGGKQILDE